MNKAKEKSAIWKKVLRWGAVILVAVAVILGIIASFSVGEGDNEVWDENTTVGNLKAKNHFIIYSDLMCPYCVAFENAIFENEEEFQNYISKNDVLVEVRLADFLYRYSESQAEGSHYSAEAVTCAEKQGKFWEYYKTATTTVWQDYYAKNGKSGFEELNSKGRDFWIALGGSMGLNETDDFRNCIEDGKTDEELAATAAKMAKMVNGLPFFKLNNYTLSGFDLSWGWDQVLMYFEAGRKS